MLSKRIVACLYRGISQRAQSNVSRYCCHRNTCVRSMSNIVSADEDTTNSTRNNSEHENGKVGVFIVPESRSGLTRDIKKPGQNLINHHDNRVEETTSENISDISDTENLITDQLTQTKIEGFDLSGSTSYLEHQGQHDEYSISTEDGGQRNDIDQENKIILVQDHHPMHNTFKDLDIPSIPREQKKVFEPIYHLAPLVKESMVLSNLVMLGVSLAEIEKQGAANMLVQLNYENDVQPLLLFLKEIGVADEDLCRVITKNPFLFKEEITDLQVRINYLRSKKFSKESISSIVTRNPKALSLTVEQLDGQLGFYQKQFKLSGSEVRRSMTKCPKLITQKRFRVQAIKEDLLDIFGFTQSEVKKMFLLSPNILLTHIKQLSGNFDYLHNVMELSHKDVLMWPQIFQTYTDRLKRRHQFLASVGRDQYDPKKENFVSLHDLVSEIGRAHV